MFFIDLFHKHLWIKSIQRIVSSDMKWIYLCVLLILCDNVKEIYKINYSNEMFSLISKHNQETNSLDILKCWYKKRIVILFWFISTYQIKKSYGCLILILNSNYVLLNNSSRKSYKVDACTETLLNQWEKLVALLVARSGLSATKA